MENDKPSDFKFVERLERKLWENKVTRTQLAKTIGVPSADIDRMMRMGLVPEADLLLKIAHALNISVDDLMIGQIIEQIIPDENDRSKHTDSNDHNENAVPCPHCNNLTSPAATICRNCFHPVRDDLIRIKNNNIWKTWGRYVTIFAGLLSIVFYFVTKLVSDQRVKPIMASLMVLSFLIALVGLFLRYYQNDKWEKQGLIDKGKFWS